MEPIGRLNCSLQQLFAALVCSLLACVLTAPFAVAAQKHAKPPRSHVGRVQTGLDVLESEKFASLRGKHVGLITNHTGVDFQGRSTVEALAKAPGVQLVALFSPEHGIAGHALDKVSSSKDPSTGLPIYSLYGEQLRPTDDMLKDIDALVFDVQDAGVRFYTYTTTMAYCMEEAAKHGIAFFVLDRPNPLNGEIIEGPMLDADKTSFVAYFSIPVRYALTIGELAQFYNSENHINADLYVIKMKNWHRNYFFESTGSRWIPPSPNLRTLKGSILYPGLEILQNAGVSVGRGTEAPFEEFGAPWMDGVDIAAELNARNLSGLRFSNQPFIPVSGLYAGQRCGGVGVRVTDRAAVRSMRMGLEIAALLQKKYPQQFDSSKVLQLIGNEQTVRDLQSGTSPEQIVRSWAEALAAFDQVRRKYFLYP
ncbi:MAG TPA: DUF1343 domain-containing protein [Verrucomicrobiae bacterium]|nr:DUF1343 domain-containing protein [Verrucomicrobiae bacterium]